MLSDLYSEKILEAAGAIPPARRLSAPSASATKTSRVCGSTVTVDIQVKNGVVVDFGMEAKACALGQAAASIVARNIIGVRTEEICALRDRMRAMLKEGGDPPHTDPALGARWKDLEALVSIRDYPQRHASTLLVFEAACACVESLKS